MNNGHLALYYLGIALLVSGCATFLGGLGYLFWLVFSEPTIITHVINTRVSRHQHYTPASSTVAYLAIRSGMLKEARTVAGGC